MDDSPPGPASLSSPLVGAWSSPTGARFRVWAPDHRELSLVLYEPNGRTESRAIAMSPERDGFFAAEVPDLAAGALYKYRIDGEGPFPDPASRAQPHGVHGPSQLVDPRAFAWTDRGWKGVPLTNAVLYEAHVGTATPEGTFDALIAKLPYLRDLGVTVLELLPVASFPGARNWGYDGVSLFAPAAPYGGPEGLRRLIDAAHGHGLAVLIDAVYNHLGPDGNYLRAYAKGYFTDRHHTPWGDAVNVDGRDAQPVREFFLANAEMWIREFHADGLRLDATHCILDDSPRHLLTEIAERARSAAPERAVLVIAEDERNEARLVTPEGEGGHGLDGVWADDFHHQLRRLTAGDHESYYADYEGTAQALSQTMQQGWYYTGQVSARHKRPRGTRADHVAPERFVYCIQNHDQVGNRALGDRLGESISAALYRAASALLLLAPHTPMLFQGQEWNATTPFLYFTDHEPGLGKLVTEGRRAEFKAFTAFAHAEVPDPQALATFERSRLDWNELTRAPHAGVHALYRELLELRRTHPALRSTRREDFEITPVGESALVLMRRSADRTLVLVANLREGALLEHTLASSGRGFTVLAYTEARRFGGPASEAPAGADQGVIALQGAAALVLEER